jgi:hemin uptake protein HemP
MVPSNTPNTEQKERPRLNSEALFAKTKEIIIEHEESEYRLRLTSNNKLILTK